LLVAVLLAGCVAKHVVPGVLRPDWNQGRGNPDPTANPAEELRGNPYGGENAPRPPAAASASGEVGGKAVAVFAAYFAGGWAPLLQLEGTFEEDPHQRALLKARDPEETPRQ